MPKSEPCRGAAAQRFATGITSGPAALRHHLLMAIDYKCRATCPMCGWSPELPVAPPPCPKGDAPICPWFLDGTDDTDDTHEHSRRS